MQNLVKEKENSEIKPIMNLERNGLFLAIPIQNILYTIAALLRPKEVTESIERKNLCCVDNARVLYILYDSNLNVALIACHFGSCFFIYKIQIVGCLRVQWNMIIEIYASLIYFQKNVLKTSR